MKSRPDALRAPLVVGIGLLTFVSLLTIRTWGISHRFWLLHDQIRDWSIALGSFWDLPLVGPPTHVGGYTIGPAFYWILWAIRVTFGPWFQNLPHAGGIGQAALQSVADVALLIAIWKRIGSLWIALATIVLVGTAGYDLCLSGLVWNPVLGSTLAKFAIAFVLLDWPRQSTARAALTAGVVWCAVQAYTGAIYVAVGVFAAMLIEPLVRRDWAVVKRNALTILLVVAALQLPYVAHQISNRFEGAAMGAVSDSLTRVVSGGESPEWRKSVDGYVGAVEFIEVRPWKLAGLAWILLASAVVVAVRYWRDPVLLAVTLLPAATAIVGYALFLAGLDFYFYMSLMPAAMLTFVLAATAMPWPKVSRAVAMALLAAALVLVPSRYRLSTTMHQMPEYRVLVDASRQIAKRRLPMRAIETEFALPPTADPEFVYTILGGRLDPASPWVARIDPTGAVTYVRVDGAAPSI